MNRILLSLVISSSMFGGAGMAGAQEPKPAPITVLKESGPVMYGRSAKIKAIVESIDLATREITVKGPKGRPLTMRVEARVKNLPDIQPGDEVVVRYHESVGVELRHAQEGEAIAPDETVMHGTEPGKEAGASSRKTEIANVESVGTREKSVVLKTPDGRFLDLYVRDEAVLSSLETGDTVVATYTEAAVVSVDGPKDKTKDTKPKKKPRKK
ncbi:MAG TPA: hypothetical protein VF460_09340 [Burkholderiales bacterium]|jgi:hypothetical protein